MRFGSLEKNEKEIVFTTTFLWRQSSVSLLSRSSSGPRSCVHEESQALQWMLAASRNSGSSPTILCLQDVLCALVLLVKVLESLSQDKVFGGVFQMHRYRSRGTFPFLPCCDNESGLSKSNEV